MILVAVGLAMVWATGCVPRREDSVVLYCAADREYAAPILDAYERGADGTQVVRQFDIEASKTLGLVTRIEQEAATPKCDVFWNNEILHTLRLHQRGLLAKHKWPIPDQWPKNYRSSDGTWVGFAARARVLLVNKDRLPDPAAWPQCVSELSEPRWNKKCSLAFPIYGTTATHMAVLATHPKALGTEQEWESWIESVSKNAVVLAGNKQVALGVSAGDLDWGLTDTDDAIIEMESGKPVGIVFPDQKGSQFGTLFIPNTLAIVKQSPHPIAAGSLADYLISEKVESRLTMSSSAHFPLWPTASESSRIKTEATRWAEVDFEKAARDWDRVRDLLVKKFEK
ncbi:MAG: extracellular solute-binding protein [Planctomycetota bacterium]